MNVNFSPHASVERGYLLTAVMPNREQESYVHMIRTRGDIDVQCCNLVYVQYYEQVANYTVTTNQATLVYVAFLA